MMGQITVSAVDVLAARPEDVYATIADYREGHPRILPPGSLYDLRVEEGGRGAGTVMRFKGRIWGIEQSFYHRVSEPEPGHILVEQDIEDPRQLATSFIVTPLEGGAKSQVEIRTTMKASRGLKGFLERLILTRANPPIYHKELKLLETVARQRAQKAAQNC